MRSWVFISLAMMIVGSLRIGAEEREGVGQRKPKGAAKQGEGHKQNLRTYRVTFEFEMEQKNGRDTTDGGKTIPGSDLLRTKSCLELVEDELFVYPLASATSESDRHQYSEDLWFEIKVKSARDNLIPLEVCAKQSRTESPKAGESRSWNLKLEGSKTAKLGEKIKLEFGDEKTLGTKCIFEGVIEKNDQEVK